MRQHNRKWLEGTLAGLAGGLAGAWTMSLFLTGLEKLKSNSAGRNGNVQADTPPPDPNADPRIALVNRALRPFGRELTPGQSRVVSPLVHFGFGGAVGAAYGAASELLPQAAGKTFGSGFGSAVWIGTNHIALPSLDLMPPANQVPIGQQATMWAAHCVYGTTAELTRRLLRGLFDRVDWRIGHGSHVEYPHVEERPGALRDYTVFRPGGEHVAEEFTDPVPATQAGYRGRGEQIEGELGRSRPVAASGRHFRSRGEQVRRAA